LVLAKVVLVGGAGGAVILGWRWREKGLVKGTLPRGSGRPCGSGGEQYEAVAVEIARRQRQLDPARQLGDPGGYLDEREPERVELGVAPERGFGCQTAQGVQEPVGGGVQHEAKLVGGGPAARGAVGGEVALVGLDNDMGASRRRHR
jgi:hypothetical protein